MSTKFKDVIHAESYLNRLRIKIVDKIINVNSNIGLKGWSAIDYLRSNGYTLKFSF